MRDGEVLAPPPAVFDPSLLRDRSVMGRAVQWAVNRPGPVFAVLRRAWPNLRVRGFVLVTRRDDVEEVLASTDVFRTRLANRQAGLHPDAPNAPVFGLGTDGPTHPASVTSVSRAMHMRDLPRLALTLRDFVEPRVAGQFRLDAGELARRAQVYMGCRYLGLDVDTTALPRFAFCCLALGNYVLGPQPQGSTEWRAARGAGAEISAVIRRSISIPGPGASADTVLGRLLDQRLDHAEIEATLTGILFGLVGGGTAAATHVMQILLARPRAMQAAQTAAIAGDDIALGRCLLEALRFRSIVLGVFRECTTAYTIAAGTSRSLLIREGDLVLAAIQSAMCDPRRVAKPGAFDPNRPAADTMVFGFDRHSCVGFAIGRIQLIETLKPLLRRRFHQSWAEHRATTYFGTVPETLRVRLR